MSHENESAPDEEDGREAPNQRPSEENTAADHPPEPPPEIGKSWHADPVAGMLPGSSPIPSSYTGAANKAGSLGPIGGTILGLVIGVGALVLCLIPMALTLFLGVFSIWPYVVLVIVSITLIRREGNRHYIGIGMLIMTALAWLVVIGPCTLLIVGGDL